MRNFYWFWFGLTLWSTRLVLLCVLYFTDAPTGGPIVDRWYRFFPHTLVIEAGVVMALAFAGGLLCTLLRGKARKIAGIAFLALGIAYMVAAGTDDEIMRWMGQHLSLSFITTYALAASDMGLVGRVFLGGAWHFLLTTFIVIAGIVGTVFLYRKMFAKWSEGAVVAVKNRAAVKNWICLGIALALAITGLTSKNWFAPSNMRWKRIAPVAFRLVDEIKYKLTEAEKRGDYAEGIELLGGFPLADYPFEDCTASASECEQYRQHDIEQFKARGDRKPDIIFFVIETFRGWTGDIRVPATCEKLPNICKLAKSGLYFPNAHSVGYPSIEGFLGVLAGVWAHPQTTFLSDYPNTRMRALPEILGEAGYYRMVLTATEPSFDNLHPWFAKWFDYSEYKPENQHDVPIANRFRELYAKRPAGQPLFFDWMSTTSHVPFSLPKEYGPTPSDPEVAYVRSLAYMDSAVGIVMDEVAKGPNADNTLFVLVGDHAFANNAQHRVSNFIGGVHDGYTWVPLIVAGPNIEPKVVTTPVSQVDIAPTVLDYIFLYGATEFFVGESLLELDPPAAFDGVDYTIVFHAASKHRPVFAFRMGDMTMITDSVTYIANIQDSTLVSAFETVLEPTWDTSHPAEGFVTGKVIENAAAKYAETFRKMRAAGHAWEYVINKNKLLPPPQR
ncbi:LTA synthase family protein [Fibrobacter sp. UBA4309]|uniref:LTA synthase family protein n=1 Tax=Fibrobacter sp. UBA4309 TaxID=1946537 RepID=UPI0025BFF3C7|nr:sulfatase-like hydrolase/transferase [Fibrobacter sp. UBA4309]